MCLHCPAPMTKEELQKFVIEEAGPAEKSGMDVLALFTQMQHYASAHDGLMRSFHRSRGSSDPYQYLKSFFPKGDSRRS